MFEYNFLLSLKEIEIHLLADRPEFANIVGNLAWDEWSACALKDFGIHSAEEWTADLLENKLNRDKAPLILVAHTKEGEFVGTVELEPDDMPNHRPLLTPWMATLLVKDSYRRQGVAGHLMYCLHTIVHSMGCPKLYLYTEAETSAAMYRRYGWSEVERLDYYGAVAILMEFDTSVAPTPRSNTA
jgi:predicted N-acetyltransferase YhbS